MHPFNLQYHLLIHVAPGRDLRLKWNRMADEAVLENQRRQVRIPVLIDGLIDVESGERASDSKEQV